VKDVQAAMKKFGRCVVAVSEGIRDEKGESIGARFAGGEKDSHGNVQMSGTGALGDYLAKYLKEKAAIKRVRADTFGYLQRSFPGVASEVDVEEAGMAGYAAVQAALLAAKGVEGVPVKGTIGIGRAKGKTYKPEFTALPAQAAAKFTRSVPDKYIAKNGHDVTKAFIEYVKPLVGDLPHCEIF
jgi:6-phosphofructokinase 1